MLKLMGAFLLVIAIGAVLVSWMTSQATRNAFTVYTTRSGQVWAQELAPLLGEYFADRGSWQGVEAYLQSALNQVSPPAGMGGPGMMGGRGNGYGRQSGMGPGMLALMNQEIILTDPNGQVIYDSDGALTGKELTPAQMNVGAPISVNNQTAGFVIVTPGNLTVAGSPTEEFLSSVNRSIVTAAIIAGVIALALGAILFFQVTSPLRGLKQAANAIARGDLSQRVAIRSKDEFGELGQSFNSMAESLGEAETLRKRMIADTAHELRTPLAVIQANLEGMIDGVLPQDADQLTALYDQTRQLNRLVGDLRLLSLAESGELQLERQPTDPETLIRRAVDSFQAQTSQQGITLEVDIQPGLPPVSVDAGRITQVLHNLLGNALRYTPAGKSICIQAEALNNADKGVRISVIDPGPGIQPEDIPHVFDRFYRADKSRSRASGGSGLGLAIVKQLVEAHGGKVGVESPVYFENGRGFGTRVFFSIA
jgi:two-component system OmpR family sensor kinase/two-component system sensor histidine kinase BaeS